MDHLALDSTLPRPLGNQGGIQAHTRHESSIFRTPNHGLLSVWKCGLALELERQSHVGTTRALIGPGKISYILSRHTITNSSTLFQDASNSTTASRDVVLRFPMVNALDFDDYVSWLETRS